MKKDVKKLLTSRGAKWFMPVPTGWSENAVDFIVCYKGKYVTIETKVHPRKATALQMDFLCDIVIAGGSAVLAYDLEEVVSMLIVVDDGCIYVSTAVHINVERRRQEKC